MIRARLVWLAFSSMMLADAGVVWSQAGAITGQVMVRENPDGKHSLLVGLNLPSSTSIDEFRIRNVAGPFSYTGGFLPDNWGLTQDKNDLVLKGPARSEAMRFRLDITSRGKESPQKWFLTRDIEARAFLGGERRFDVEFKPSLAPKLEVQSSLYGALEVPHTIAIGLPFTVSAQDGYTAGEWSYSIAGHLIPGEAPGGARYRPLRRYNSLEIAAYKLGMDALESGPHPVVSALTDAGRQQSATTPPPKSPVPNVDDFRTAGEIWWPTEVDAPGMPGVKMKFHYTDEWGDRTVDAVASDIVVERPMYFQTCQPAIASGSSMVFAGQTLCLTGCFRDATVPMTLNGNRNIFPSAFSPTSMQLYIPPDVTPGPNTISYGSSTSFPFTALGMNGTIDQNLLWKGQSTTMRLEVLGTDLSLPVEVVNTTPAVISVEGGERQVINSPGGSPNAMMRSVRGIHKGDFKITYRLMNASCDATGK